MPMPDDTQERFTLARSRLNDLRTLVADCRLCPRECRVKRYKGELGECGLPAELRIHSPQLHHGEEPELSGQRGSGTIFFSSCNLACLYCQNCDISQLRRGLLYTAEDLAEMMLTLKKQGAHNINLVTPTPQVHGIVEALAIAWEEGLDIPIVYNTGGYD
ncbi:4Fe-4S cluster-binding domain-containing protein, partial [bacterium]|nr:4Fe-4S cluster-binding domain-containing protein [bacterium]